MAAEFCFRSTNHSNTHSLLHHKIRKSTLQVTVKFRPHNCCCYQRSR